jgi:HD-like signal output (HDOD) protein
VVWLDVYDREEDLAFTAGLMNGLGSVLIYMGDPSAANEINQHIDETHSRALLEINRLGFTSEEVCAELCRRWKFSPELIGTLAYCGDPMAIENAPLSAYVVHLARFITQSQRRGLDEEIMLASFPYPVAERLGLSKTSIAENLSEILALESGLEGLID